ncbi:MAG TPA: LPS assembly lipoprotein LptE [Candidatus Hydrogenedentes bacterium]|nr:LPS assembly lipoprotein LptE [Candidatus Hydrogenedentota bacterium]HPG65733.1 LPS assembly lipoprotein LptE [Candidatus Hydrogenedentota bacterium]
MNALRLATAAAALGLSAVIASGCGYSIHSTLDEQYQTIHVAPFLNYSKEYDFQAPLTNAVIRKFLTDGRLQVAPESEADLLVEGAITEYRLKGLTYDEADEVTQFYCVVSAAIRLTDVKNGKVLWQEPIMTGETSFYTRAAGQSSDRLRGNAETFLPTVRSFATEEENRAASEALEQLASDIFYRTIEPW